MVLLGYFYREAREAASIDAAWRIASEALGASPSFKHGMSSVGTTAIKSSTSSLKTIPLPNPCLSRPPAASSYSSYSGISRQVTAPHLATSTTTTTTTIGLSAISDISISSTSDGSLFEFTDAERQKAKAYLNEAFEAHAAASSSASTASHSGSSLSLFSGPTTGAPLPRLNDSASSSPELAPRGRSSSVWSSTASVNSVVHQRNRAPGYVEDIVW